MRVPFTIGTVGHFGLAVRDPRRSAKWFVRVLGLRKEFEFEEVHPLRPADVDLMTLRKALKHLKKHKVKVEDPGNEIGPEAPGSPHMGLWFRDPDGYRWELSVQGGK